MAQEFESEFTGVSTAVQGGAGNSGSEIVASALSWLIEARRADLQFLVDWSVAAINGATNATNAYVRGDLEMAANAQSAAGAAPDGSFAPSAGGPRPN